MPRRSRAIQQGGGRTAGAALAVALAVVAVLAVTMVALADHVPGGGGHLAAVGPVSGTDGFPVWYKDETGRKMTLCLDGNDPLCGFLPGDIPNPDLPVSFPDNFPNEAFYMLGTATMDTAGGRATNVLALEAAFANAVRDGDQMVFGRVRHRIDGLQAGATYTITHPYGTDVVVADPVGSIRFTEDIGTTPGIFTTALKSRVGPFLRWDPAAAPAAPAGYIGDPAVEHAIAGSPFGTNVFRVQGPGAGAPGAANLCNPTPPGLAATDCIETGLFTLQGKIATNAGVEIARATYSREASGAGRLDVFAGSEPFQSVEVSGSGLAPTRLRGDDAGNYYARIGLAGAPPSSVSISNVGDTPVTTKTAAPADLVLASATYDADAQVLSIEATSSDLAVPPVLTAVGYGALSSGALVVNGVAAPPASVMVSSSAGGSDAAPVVASGAPLPAIPVQAFAGIDQRVLTGALVTLDGTGSSGPVGGYSWTQVPGPTVTLSGATTARPSFTAPAAPAVLGFELTVTGPGGPSTSSVTVTVVAGVPAPVANAGPDQVVAQDVVVALDGRGSTGDLTSYSWAQLAGPAVTLTGATTATPTFRTPKRASVFGFQLTATGPGGSTTDTVDVTTTADTLATTLVEYRSAPRSWRIRGTSTVPGPGVTVTIHVGPTLAGPVLGQAAVDALGAWDFRQPSSALPPDQTSMVSIESTSGGRLPGVPVTIRR